ncbi:unnamed protein product [Arabidopsis lyrata]|uniref:flocculation protein FLO11 n=1 Tax=Arabidopsis lyrata subsp. lyrata TaxID=81972 RepID=UPI000A29EA59|nr:flocculation protein FLO11 [Arabidopsis lyrata subsp. lyrata]CAH8269723.1 unnamed protein product [Arabidopsis lyrata]|eukprot:XP_002870933.2 flocculation protein FLO11 [Arabidopsis lyrata subsp. lyrata]
MLRHEKGHQATLLMGSANTSSTTAMSSQQYPVRRTTAEDFLYSENEKSDYEWLVTPPGSPSRSVTNQLDAPDANLMGLISRLENYSKEESNNQTTSLHSSSSVSGIRRPSSSSSSRSTSRPPTPTRKSKTPAKRPSTPTSRATSTAARATLTSSSTSSLTRSRSRPSSSSGTSRVTLTAARATRPTTSTGQKTTGSATSTRSNNRPMSAPNLKPGSRSSTPTRRPSTPNGSSTVLISKPIKPALSQGASPIVRPRPWEPYEMPGFSIEAPSNLRTTLPDRPQTASSSRTRAFDLSSSSRSASIERDVAKRQSCSPSRDRASNGNVNGAVPSLRGRRAKTTNNDDGGLISHVAKGNQKVERIVNMRKLAQPQLTESGGRGLSGGGGSSAGKSSSRSDGFGFGRNLSKSSIDMALRHMDVRRGSMAGNFRPSVTKVPATSLNSVRSCRNRPVISSGSSESSVNILRLDGSDDNLSDISYS